ncbi:MAG: Cys-tRNA(Pro) deacylase [Oscillospiraceae bacterium]|nr:Cys-tRNA(Pro) deacylase [Oscillospiraceae bacterium]
MAQVKTNAMRFLDKQKAQYKTHFYDSADGAIDGISVAAKVGISAEKVFKTLVTQGSSKEYFVFVIPVENELDLKKAARAVGEKSVEMIPVADINKVTGYIRGGCSPIGMKKSYITVIHQTAHSLDTMVVSGGKIGTQIELSPNVLAQLVNAKFEDLTKA